MESSEYIIYGNLIKLNCTIVTTIIRNELWWSIINCSCKTKQVVIYACVSKRSTAVLWSWVMNSPPWHLQFADQIIFHVLSLSTSKVYLNMQWSMQRNILCLLTRSLHNFNWDKSMTMVIEHLWLLFHTLHNKLLARSCRASIYLFNDRLMMQ